MAGWLADGQPATRLDSAAEMLRAAVSAAPPSPPVGHIGLRWSADDRAHAAFASAQRACYRPGLRFVRGVMARPALVRALRVHAASRRTFRRRAAVT